MQYEEVEGGYQNYLPPVLNAIGNLKNSLSDVLVKRICTTSSFQYRYAYRRWHHVWIPSIFPFSFPFCVSRIVLAASTASSIFSMIVARSLAQKHNVGFESCHWMTGRPDLSIVLSTTPSIFIAGRVKSAHCGRSIHRTSANSPLRGLQSKIVFARLYSKLGDLGIHVRKTPGSSVWWWIGRTNGIDKDHTRLLQPKCLRCDVGA